jgi:hypothetical protein
MYKKYHFKDEKEVEYLLSLERKNKNKNKNKNKYKFISDLLNITIPYISIIGTILIIAFLI